LPIPSFVLVSKNANTADLWSARMLSERLNISLSYLTPNALRGRRHQRKLRASSSQQPVIAVGFSAAVSMGINPKHLAPLGPDSFLLTACAARGLPAGSIAIASSESSSRGTMYGVYKLLREIGFEFYTNTLTKIPSLPFSIRSSALDVVVEPFFYFRDLSSVEVSDNALRIRNGTSVTFRPCNLSAALGLNGPWSNPPVGGYVGPSSISPPGTGHTAMNLLSPTLNGDSPTCAGEGSTPEPHKHNTPCPEIARKYPEWFVCYDPAKNGRTSEAWPFMWPCNNLTLANS